VLLTVGLVAVWKAATSDAADALFAAGAGRGINIPANLQAVALHPVAVFRDLFLLGGPRVLAPVLQFVGSVGWSLRAIPLRPMYLILLLIVSCAELRPRPLNTAERVILACIAAASLLSTYLVLFLLDGTVKDGRYAFWSAGVQGRYAIPFCLAGFLALKSRRLAASFSSSPLERIVLGVSGFYGLLTLATILRLSCF
jgi:hypothetical protein